LILNTDYIEILSKIVKSKYIYSISDGD